MKLLGENLALYRNDNGDLGLVAPPPGPETTRLSPSAWGLSRPRRRA